MWIGRSISPTCGFRDSADRCRCQRQSVLELITLTAESGTVLALELEASGTDADARRLVRSVGFRETGT